MNKILIIVAFAKIVTGCAVGPNFKSPEVEIPDEFINQNSVADNEKVIYDRWWEMMGDKALDSLVDRAIEVNKDIDIATIRIEQAQLEAKNAGKALLPMVQLSAGGGA